MEELGMEERIDCSSDFHQQLWLKFVSTGWLRDVQRLFGRLKLKTSRHLWSVPESSLRYVAFAAQKRWPRSWTTREMTSLKSGPRRQGKLCDKSTGSVLVDGSWASNSTIITNMSVCNLCILYTSIFIYWYLFRIIAPFGHSGYWQLQCFMIRSSGSQSTRGRLLLWWGQGRCCSPKKQHKCPNPKQLQNNTRFWFAELLPWLGQGSVSSPEKPLFAMIW